MNRRDWAFFMMLFGDYDGDGPAPTDICAECYNELMFCTCDRDDDEEIDCPKCKGYGTERDGGPCLHCDGTGIVGYHTFSKKPKGK